MIQKTNSSKHIPHIENVVSIHKNYIQDNPLLSIIDEYNPLYAGGYAKALVFAPRTINNYSLNNSYFTDFDLYFNHIDVINILIKDLKKYLKTKLEYRICESDNAISLIPNETDRKIIQIVKGFTGSPEEILSSFDFKNCAIGYSPLNENIYFHDAIFKLYLNKKLDILNPWMLDGEISEACFTIQLLRFKKYCERWNLTLSKRSFDKLYSLYCLYPNLILKSKTFYRSQSSYSTTSFLNNNSDINIWLFIKKYLIRNEFWNNELDIHGIITTSNNNSRVDDSLSFFY